MTESEVSEIFTDYVLSYEACKSSKDKLIEIIRNAESNSCPAK